MDISQASAVGSMVSSQATGDAVGISVLKKAMENDAQVAAQLVNSLPQPATPAKEVGQSATLGKNIDVTA